MAIEIAILVLAGILVLLGIAGTVYPALPGPILVFGGLFLAAWANDYEYVSWFTLTVLGLLTILTFIADFIATVLGARRVGASGMAIWGSFFGTIVGMFFGLLGLLLGPFAGAVVGEFVARGSVDQSARVGIATWLGLIFGTLAKLALIFAMLGVFLIAYFI
jgi:uncharacterized protein YqgC (DUF456 family)